MENKLAEYKNYLLARNLSTTYCDTVKLWLAYMEKNKIETITQEVVTQFFITNSKYSVETCNKFVKACRSYYTAFLQVPKERNEWYKIKLMKVARKIPEYLQEEDIENAKKYLITYHSNKTSPDKIRAILDFLYYSGCRKMEFINLKRADFNLEENTAKLYGKGDKERIICYPNKVKKEIELYFSQENEENNAFNISEDKLKYMIKLIQKHLGKKVYIHLFRHSMARNLIYNRGMDINTVSKLLGHASLTTTMIYVNPDEQTIKANYKKLVG